MPVGTWGRGWPAALAVGGAALAAGMAGGSPAQVWPVYLVNVVFWTGLAAGAVLFSAVLTLTGARWAGALQRLAEGFAPFLPVSCLLLVGLWPGREVLFPDLASSFPARKLWLDPAFLFPRDGAALALLAAAGLVLAAGGRKTSPRSPAPAVVYALLYAVVLSLVGFDWIMALDPRWMSTLFGAYYFVGSFYAGLAALAVLAGVFAQRLRLGPAQTQDLGTLLLGFAFTTGYLFFVQFLVIWFANVPAETHYLLLRLREKPWGAVSWAVLVVGFCVPVAALLFRGVKARPAALRAVGCVALVGLWLERFVLVVPSLAPSGGRPPGWAEFAVTAGFLGLVAGCVGLGLHRSLSSEGTAP